MALETIFRFARIRPDKTAIIHCGTRVSYLQFACAIEALRDHFEAEGVKAGDFCVVSVHSLLDAWVIVFALRALGADTVATQGPDDAERIGLQNVTHFVSSEADPYCESAITAAAISGARAIIVTPDVFANAATPTLNDPTRGRAEGVHVLLTSGTTGDYKAVRMSNDVLAERVAKGVGIWARDAATNPDNDFMGYGWSLGLWSVSGFTAPLAPWSVGGTAVYEQRPGREAEFLTYPVKVALITVAGLARVLEVMPEDAPRRDDMAFLIVGGALPWSIAERTKARITNMIVNTLGSTEVGRFGVAFIQNQGDQLWYTIDPNYVVEIVDPNGVPLPNGEVGLLRVKLPSESIDYMRRDDEKIDAIRDHYFYSGDLGLVGPDGRVGVRGRADDVISIRGDKAPAAPFEEHLRTALKLTDACLLSIIDLDGAGEVIHAILESKTPIDDAMVRAATRGMPFEPASIRTLAELPRNGMGKVDRAKLRATLFEDADTTRATKAA